MSQFIEMFNDSPLVRLEDHIETQSGGTPNTKKSEYYDGGTIPWLSSGEVNQGYISSTEKYITEEGLENSAAKWVPKNSVVIAMYGATAGKVGFITIPLTTNQAVCALLPNDAFNPLYLYYAVSSQKNWMIAQCRGAAQPNISQGIIRSMEIPMPSLSEQMQFVNIIKQADKSEFVGFKSQFIEMFAFQDLSLTNPSDDFAKKCYDDTSSATKVPAGDYQNNGRYAIYDQSQDCDIAGYTDSIEGVCNNYPAVLFGDHSRVIKYINQPFYIGADGVKIIRPKGDDLLPEFLYYDLLYHNIPNTGYNRHFKYVKMLKLTEASIDEQEEFLKIAHQADKSEYYN